MSKKKPEPTLPPRERAFLVGVELKGQKTILALNDSLAELALLADTAGLDVTGELTQKMDRPNVETYIGAGKVDELKALVEETLAQVVVFDEELNPRHQRELEKVLGEKVRVMDRTGLILDIFAQHARTKEGMLQVELAQYEYYLPRLTRQWTHLARQAGGGGGRTGSSGGVGLRGPGETQLEVDRRAIRKRIARLKEELDKVEAHRSRYRAQRKRSRIPTVALVGYTNAGKSTLLNRLSRSDVYVADQLFATLDPTTRRVELPGGTNALFTDTVGFIQKLPTTLVAAFHATLEEIAEADLLLHVVDISHPNALNQYESVQMTLDEIGAGHIPAVSVLNKIDRLHRPQSAQETMRQVPKSAAVSALKGTGIQEMLALVHEELYESFVPVEVKLPYQQGALISLFHEMGQVERVEHERGGVLMQGRIPGRLAAQFKLWTTKKTPAQAGPEEAE
ncbi:MAG: GTPase HflX [Anaerolineaceae bacterium]|nr:GTPase HflX [Anaerolineae bacterium]MBL1172732.1 GTPase HflX [Chloroflexota bacterium]MDL1925632.1 GTPase HflX [Anaerolineae bacterium AMX1]WKZ55053.1 MAG: GTPase HflX [Anaerolineales bacterium]GJQ39448.1 MAG: GTPase HflX [Anaerolineaceae bacterium]